VLRRTAAILDALKGRPSLEKSQAEARSRLARSDILQRVPRHPLDLSAPDRAMAACGRSDRRAYVELVVDPPASGAVPFHLRYASEIHDVMHAKSHGVDRASRHII
jgi:hypothetical protein